MARTKTYKIIALTLLALATCLVVPISAHAIAINSNPNGVTPLQVVEDLSEWSFWLFLLITLMAGAIGGFVYELLTFEGKIEFPHRITDDELNGDKDLSGKVAKYILNLGIISRVFIGAFAAIASLLFLAPTTTIELIAMGISCCAFKLHPQHFLYF